jgi:hypothetical protein
MAQVASGVAISKHRPLLTQTRQDGSPEKKKMREGHADSLLL